jgi:hypothetical protein
MSFGLFGSHALWLSIKLLQAFTINLGLTARKIYDLRPLYDVPRASSFEYLASFDGEPEGRYGFHSGPWAIPPRQHFVRDRMRGAQAVRIEIRKVRRLRSRPSA